MSGWRQALSPAISWGALALALTVKLALISWLLKLHLTPQLASSLVSSLAFIALLAVPATLFARRGASAYGLALSSFCGLLGQVDLMHYRYFNDLPSVRQLGYAGQLLSVGPTVWSTWRATDLCLFVDTLFLLALYLRWNLAPASYRARLTTALIATMLGATSLLAGGRLVALRSRAIFATAYQTAFESGLLPYHYGDLKTVLRAGWARREPAEDLASILALCAASRRSIAAPSPYQGLAKGQNILVIVLESWQDFALDLDVEGQKVMPFMAAYKDRCLYFSNYYEETNLASSADGEWLMNLSLHPAAQGASVFTYSANHFRGLPEILVENGYSTLYFGYYERGFWNAREMVPAYGFQESFFAPFGPTPTAEEKLGWGLTDVALLRRTLPILSRQKAPFYAMVKCSMAHHPFRELNAQQKDLKLPPAMDGAILGDYLQMCRFRDHGLAEFLYLFERSPLAANTTLIITGDHAAPLTERELRPLLTSDKSSRTLTYASLLKMPLLIRLPTSKGEVLPQALGQLDFAPTLCHLLGLGHQRSAFLGRNAFLGSTTVAMRKVDCVTDGSVMLSLGEGKAARLPGLELLPFEDYRDLVQRGVAQWRASDEILEHDLTDSIVSHPHPDRP